MFIKEVKVPNREGLHARPATQFVKVARVPSFAKTSIWLENVDTPNRRADARSLLGVLSLGIVGGMTIRIIADGDNEEEAVNSLVSLVESGFAE